MNQFKDLLEFVNLAEKNRKYATNTAHGYRAALKVFSKEFNELELDSLDLIQENIEEIFRNVVSANQQSFSIGTLNTYKVRLLKIIEDYQKYGADPSNLEHWNKPIRKPFHQLSTTHGLSDEKQDTSIHHPSNLVPTSVHNIELTLRPNTKFSMSVPTTITIKEATTIKSIIDALANNNP